ncbi:MAG: hypothetical protein FIA94_14910, partial [Nitrospirae bacterium]|nr:hypothetical protein [Nitrospirota bacterium]
MRKYLFSLFFLLLPALCFGLTVDTPTVGELIPAGSVYTSIQWTPAVGSTKFNIYASYDNGLTWSTPLNTTGKVPGTTFDWTIPLMTKNKTKCKIKVIGYNDAGTKLEAGYSSAFTIDVLNVTYPNVLTDVLDAGHIQNVTWGTATLSTVTNAKLLYTVDGGLTWLPIAAIAGNPGVYAWTVPQFGSDQNANLMVVLMNGTAKVASDISGTFVIEASLKGNANASGSFSMPYMDYDYYTLPGIAGTHIFDVTMNGAGLFDHTTYASSLNPPPSSAANVPYTVYPDGQIVAGNARGIISSDDSMILLAELGKGKLLGSGLAIKTASGLSNAVLDGTYFIGQIGMNLAGGSWGSRFTATFYGDGNANLHCDDMTGGCAFTDLAITYTVDALTGRVSDSLGQQGMVTADGKVFTLVDFNAADNMISRLVGMKKSSGGLSDATAAGKFIAATFGVSDTHGPWTDIFQLKLNGKGGGSAT